MKRKIFLLALIPGLLAALPENSHILAGEALVQHEPALCVIHQGTDKAIIQWDSFSIGQGETVRFVQPSSAATSLNRVVGGNPSVILGHLEANGQVFLINPQGILFGQKAVVNTAALVASTLDMADRDFLEGKGRFTGSDGAICNQGLLKAGRHITLLAGRVVNEGLIEVDLGTVNIMAGSQVSLALDSKGLLTASVDADVMNAAVCNTGSICASIVTLDAASTNAVFDKVINNQGIITASSIEKGEGGKIILRGGAKGVVELAGRLQAKGGSVNVKGERTFMASSAFIDVSGQKQGGSVYLLADKQISLHGQVLAAAKKGQGGFIDTSAPHLDLEGFRARAPGQQAGSWLIDPVDLTINHSSTNSGGAFDGGSTTDTWSGASSPATLGDSVINGALAAATNVVIDATTGTGGSGTITLEGSVGNAVDITIPAHKTLTLKAGDGGCLLNGYVVLALDSDATLDINAGIGGVTMTAANDAILGTSSGVGTLLINTTGDVSIGNNTVGNPANPLADFTVANCTAFANTDAIQATTVSLTSSGDISLETGVTTREINITDTGGSGTTIDITINTSTQGHTQIDRMIIPNTPDSVTVTMIDPAPTSNQFRINTPVGDWNLNTDVIIAPQSGQACDIWLQGYLQGDNVNLSTGVGNSIYTNENGNSYVKVNSGLTISTSRVGTFYKPVTPLNVEMPASATLTVDWLGSGYPSQLTNVSFNFINDFLISQLALTSVLTAQDFYLSAPTLTFDTTPPAALANQYVTFATTSGDLVFADGSQASGKNVALNAAGSVVNNSSAFPIVATAGTLNITAEHGTIGTLSQPVTVATPSTVTVFAGGFDPSNYVSIAISGTVGDNTLHFNGYTAGFIYFNGRLLLPYFPPALSELYVGALAYAKTSWWPSLRDELITSSPEKEAKILDLTKGLYDPSYRGLLKKLENQKAFA